MSLWDTITSKVRQAFYARPTKPSPDRTPSQYDLLIAPTGFKVGDVVGQSTGDGAVQIELTEVSNDSITAKVIVLGDFYSTAHLTGSHNTSQGFVLGETLVFWREWADRWNIDRPNSPWHELCCSNGIKTFEHYR